MLLSLCCDDAVEWIPVDGWKFGQLDERTLLDGKARDVLALTLARQVTSWRFGEGEPAEVVLDDGLPYRRHAQEDVVLGIAQDP